MFNEWKIKKLKKKLKVLRHNRQFEQQPDTLIAKEVDLYLKLAEIYSSLAQNKTFPNARVSEQECYRAAAALNDGKANFLIAKALLDEGRYRLELQEEAILDNDYNKSHMEQLFSEAHAYLKAGDKLNNIAAKRHRGLCYINAWGVSKDTEKGLELFVESINQEGSWDKLSEIFKIYGIDKPEYFNAVMSKKTI